MNKQLEHKVHHSIAGVVMVCQDVGLSAEKALRRHKQFQGSTQLASDVKVLERTVTRLADMTRELNALLVQLYGEDDK